MLGCCSTWHTGEAFTGHSMSHLRTFFTFASNNGVVCTIHPALRHLRTISGFVEGPSHAMDLRNFRFTLLGQIEQWKATAGVCLHEEHRVGWVGQTEACILPHPQLLQTSIVHLIVCPGQSRPCSATSAMSTSLVGCTSPASFTATLSRRGGLN